MALPSRTPAEPQLAEATKGFGEMRRVLKLGLVPKFALLSLLLIALLGVALGSRISEDIWQRNVTDAKQLAVTVTRLGIRPHVTPWTVQNGMSTAQIDNLDEVLRTDDLGRTVTRIKLWNRKGQVVYSDERRLIGRQYEIEEDLREALDGEVIAEVTELTSEENEFDHGHGDQLEVYVPIVLEGRREWVGAFELCLPYAPIADAISSDRNEVFLLLAAGLGLLWVVLFRIVHGASRRLRRQAEENEHQALHDGLTDLPNRVLFQDRVAHAIQTSRRSLTSLAVVLMDLDRFKEVNDTLGHHTGDELLRQIGQRVSAAVRASDTIARLGGDEFGLLLPGVGSAASARQAAQKVIQALEEPFQLDAITVDIEASTGIALYPQHGRDAETLLRHADVAMYVAKDKNNSMEVYAPELDQYSRERLMLVGELHRAMDQHEIVLHYQPKIDLRSGLVEGVEALIRWQHPTLGLLAPDSFLPAAEHTGLIRPLTQRVLDLAARQCEAWRAEGRDLKMAVNLSARNLHDVDLPDSIAEVLRRHSIPASALKLEITESTIMSDPVRVLGVARRLHALGVGLSIDDFGTGYSSLSYLKQFPIQEIKIDKSFVLDMEQSDDDAAIVRSTIGLARNLGLDVVAEGVETDEARHQLMDLGCDYAQGFLWCRPLPAAELGRWLDDTIEPMPAPARSRAVTAVH